MIIAGGSAPKKRRWFLASLSVLSLVLGLTGCTSRSGAGNAAPQPASLKTSDPRLPTGWARFAYGALSVGAPSGWAISSAPLFCGSPPNVVNEYTLSAVRAASCPAYGPESPTVEAVAIECLRGQASRLYSSTSSTTIIDRRVLYREDSYVYLHGNGWEGVVLLPINFSPGSTLGAEILSTVEPSGKPC